MGYLPLAAPSFVLVCFGFLGFFAPLSIGRSSSTIWVPRFSHDGRRSSSPIGAPAVRDTIVRFHFEATTVHSASRRVFRGMTTRVAINEPVEIAYERAFEEHWTDVFRFALAWTNEWTAAEDLAQESFLRLWNQRGRLDWTRPVLPWLLVATRRLATDRFRALKRRLSAPTHAAVIDADPALRARWLDVCAAMDALSSLERTALVMTALQGATYDEAADVLGTTAGALRAAVSRARAKLETA